MNKEIRTMGLIFTCLMLSACIIQSVSPFYTKDLVTNLTEINGNWQLITELGKDVSKESITPWKFKNRAVKTFSKNGNSGIFDVVYFKIKDNIFADVYPGSPEENIGIWWTFHIFPVHSLCKIELRRNSLTIIPMNPKWFKENRDKAGKLTYVTPEGETDMDLYTSSPEDWVAFLKENLKNKELFNYDNKFFLKRIKKDSK